MYLEATMKTLDGTRVGLVKGERHAAELYKLVDRSREHLSNLVWAAAVDEAGVLEHCKKPNVRLIRINHDTIVGCIELREQPNGWYQVGYWMGKDYAGKGIMKKAVSMLIVSGYIDQHLYACIKEHNARSRAVLEANGFREMETVDGWSRLYRIVARPAGQPPALPWPWQKS